MCLIAFAYKQHHTYDLIFAANRDESYDRPTRKASFWNNYPHILAGKDLQAGGTWMGITQDGTFSALTNYRDPSIKRENPPSRGQLVLDYLKKNGDPKDYLQNIHQKAEQYMGFNLLAGTIDQLAYYSNQQQEITLLDSGLYTLSNHLLNTPWPKTEQAKNKLKKLIAEDTISEEALFKLLADDREAPDDQLPNTGIPKDAEKKISPIFIKTENYGTRCSTLLLIRKDGRVTFTERRFKAGSTTIKDENRYQFTINQPY